MELVSIKKMLAVFFKCSNDFMAKKNMPALASGWRFVKKLYKIITGY